MSRESSNSPEQSAPLGKALAVFAPRIGAVSETFVRRHVLDLAPGHTVTLAHERVARPFWDVSGPLLLLDEAAQNPRGVDALARRAFETVARGRRMPRLALSPLGLARRASGWSARHTLAQEFLQRHNARVLLGEFLDLTLPWLPVAQKLNIPLWAHAHGYDVSQMLSRPEWQRAYLRFNEAQGVITMSEYSRQKLIAIGVRADLVHVVPYGVEVGEEETRRHGDTEKFVSSSFVLAVAIGRMVPKKAPLATLRAFADARRQMPNLRLEMVGDGPLLPAARDFVTQENLRDAVVLHGALSAVEAQNVLKRADLFVQHSVVDARTGDEEGLPVSILEAMARGKPVLSTRHAGIPEAVIDHQTGLLVSENDVEAMSHAWLQLARDPDLRFRFGQAGATRARELFSWNAERAALRRLLELDDEL